MGTDGKILRECVMRKFVFNAEAQRANESFAVESDGFLCKTLRLLRASAREKSVYHDNSRIH